METKQVTARKIQKNIIFYPIKDKVKMNYKLFEPISVAYAQ